MKKILLLGSGELGKELTISLQRLGCFVIACDSYNDAPAMHVSQEKEVFNMLDENALNDIIAKHKPDLIVPEIEAIETTCLENAEQKGFNVIPSARAVHMTMNRDKIRNLANFLDIKTARYGYASSLSQLIQVSKDIGGKVAIKPVMSSSGKGQSYAETETELKKGWDLALKGMRGKKRKVIVEQFINFKYEVTLLTILDSFGNFHYCQPIGHHQERGDFQQSWQPMKCSKKVLRKMKSISKKIVKDLGGKGLFGIEFFVTKDDHVYFSELSPRPHDTGMVTMYTQNFSEFDLHARALLNLPIPSIKLYKKGVSQVILANKVSKGKFFIEGIEKAFEDKSIDLRIFGKPSAKPYRRLGVIFSENIIKAKEALSKIKIIDI